MKRLLLSAIFGLAILTACEKKQDTVINNETALTDDHSNHADEMDATVTDEHADTSAKLELDNGKKWKTNTEMLPFILEQERLIKAYDSDTGDFSKLAADLDAANTNLIKSCTMTGKSHDMLHVWLTDHMKNIDLLSKTTNREEAEKITDRLEDSMENYHQYFN